MILVSIIVPCYNSEKYIGRCIDSLIGQTWEDIEIILVNDGSTDNTAHICEGYAENDKRIKAINKERGGVVSARQKGIDEAKGKLITFVDSDDWIDLGFVEAAVKAFQNNPETDIYIGGMVHDFDNGGSSLIGIIGLDHLFNREKAIDEMFRHTFFRWELCGKVYNSNLFYGLSCPEEFSMAEDLYCNWYLFNHAERVFYSAKHKYHYYINEDSATHKFNVKTETTLDVYDSIYESEYELPYYARIMLMRNSIKFYAYKIRELYFENSKEYLNDIKSNSNRLRELIDFFPDAPEINTGIMKALLLEDTEQYKVFTEEFEKIHKAAEEASGYEKIYIYGTGVAAEYIFRSFSDVDKKRITFVVSDNKYNADKCCERDVYRLSEIKVDNENSIFVMSIRNNIRAEVVNDLRMAGHNNIIEIDLRNIYARIR